jgi:hypothetical protein
MLRPLVYHLFLVIKASFGVIYTQKFANEHGEVSQKPINNLGGPMQWSVENEIP